MKKRKVRISLIYGGYNMKQSTNPIFRNCPNADIFYRNLKSDCRRCELYQHCIKKKERRKHQKRRKRKIRRKRIKMGLLFSLVVFLIANIYLNTIANEIQIKGDPTLHQYCIVKPEEFNAKNTIAETEIESIKTEEKISENEIQELQCENLSENILEPKLSAYEPGKVYYYNISDEDKLYISKLLYKEARGEIYEGKVAVASTVLNRYYSDDARFERDSIYSVINQSGAFASIDDVTINMVMEIPELEHAVEDACLGWDPTRKMFASGALFFYAPEEIEGYQKEIREGITVLKIGNHNFHIDLNM